MNRMIEWVYLVAFAVLLFVCWPFIRDWKGGDDDEQLR